LKVILTTEDQGTVVYTLYNDNFTEHSLFLYCRTVIIRAQLLNACKGYTLLHHS